VRWEGLWTVARVRDSLFRLRTVQAGPRRLTALLSALPQAPPCARSASTRRSEPSPAECVVSGLLEYVPLSFLTLVPPRGVSESEKEQSPFPGPAPPCPRLALEQRRSTWSPHVRAQIELRVSAPAS
jgi:hypothetical protein